MAEHGDWRSRCSELIDFDGVLRDRERSASTVERTGPLVSFGRGQLHIGLDARGGHYHGGYGILLVED